MMREPVHAELDHARRTRLHAEYRAAFHLEAMLRQRLAEKLGLIAAPMADEVVERRPAIRVQRQGQENDRAGLCHTRQLLERSDLIIDVFDDVESAHEIE